MEYSEVSYRYKGEATDALRGFNLVLKPGKVVALLGPNGSGKSTVLGLGAHWLEPTTGAIHRSGRAAYLPQSERLAFSFSCVEYVSFGRAPHLPYLSLPSNLDKEKARGAIESVGMGLKADRQITALSGGELQLIRIARALVQEARTVLLDEPSDMLDPAHVATMAGKIRSLAESGIGVLFSTHDLAFALACADDAALLRNGCLAGFGPAQEVLSPSSLGDLYDTPFTMSRIPTPFIDR
jgi:iron complex transport system ATP-binding protein